VTSDHRVAGSSPAGCKYLARADFQAIKHLKYWALKSAVIRFSGFTRLSDGVCADKGEHFSLCPASKGSQFRSA
jgi:hypothetical protein